MEYTKTRSIIKKTGMVAAGAVPIVASFGIQPAHAGPYDQVAYFKKVLYPNCSSFEGGYFNYTSSHHAAHTYVNCNYSGLILIKVKYKDGIVGGPQYVGIRPNEYIGDYFETRYPQPVVRSCSQAGQDGLPWGPADVWDQDGNVYAMASCDF